MHLQPTGKKPWGCSASQVWGRREEGAQGASPLIADTATEVLGCGACLNLLLLALQKTTTLESLSDLKLHVSTIVK